MAENVEIVPFDLESIQQSILTMRGEKVLLDFQLARLYGVETRVLKQAVKRNMERFPSDFMFKLTREESNFLINRGGSQIVIPEGYNFGGANPYAFTEQGVAMLSSVLHSKLAIQVNMDIMRAFVAARKVFMQSREQGLAIDELRLKMRELEDALENNLGTVNDLSEEMHQELDNIYNAIGALSVKQQHANAPLPQIGYEATARRLENGE